ncbi:NAD(P)/FAD-dependent oxidoreductase [Georgenia sp. H159]|uniref:flavin-containing monooxygenase n=1 Tax=Georgenia sp. H159 TaxID=3076115 RepID=UPI002D780A2D|nr:NAD(P)/FAD-dependent oxidoreductase [Georgenia sp. H159]
MTTPLEDLQSQRVIVVGAGQAGLAMGHALIRTGLRPQVDFTILDADVMGERAWDRRWHSLRLFTPAKHASLPGMPFPGSGARYPRTDEVADYLEDYANQLGLAPRWGTRVHGLRLDPHRHELTLVTNIGEIATRNVVAATGPFTEPRFPEFASRVRVSGQNLHSDSYTHPKQLPDGSVLIIGAGNTGRQLARELAGSHEVTLAVGVPQRELPQRFLGVDIFSWMTATGILRVPARSPVGLRLSHREVVIGQSLHELRALGVRIVPRLLDAAGSTFHSQDGTSLTAQSVLWATGYRPGFGWLPGQVRDSNGVVVQTRGTTCVPGLYVLGLPWMHTRSSALLTGVGRDAARIARTIGRQP